MVPMTKVDRLLAYLLTFQNNDTVRAQDLAERFEISVRTVYRDIDALCQVGVPLVGTPGEGYQLMDGYYLPPVMFTEDETRALALALSMLIGFGAEGRTRDSAETARDKITTILPRRQQSEVAALRAVMRFYTFPNPPINFDDGIFVNIQKAIHDNQLVTLDYHAYNSDTVTTRDVEPMQLILVNRVWMLIGWCRLRKGRRNFRLDRINQLTVQRVSFEPRDVVINKFPVDFVEVRVRFAHASVRWVREEQHFGYRDEADEETGVVMRYEVSDVRQLQPWLLRWGNAMEVLSPPSLRAEIAREIAAMAEKTRVEARQAEQPERHRVQL